MKRFLPWLVPIVGLLIAIPLLLMGKVTVMAKLAGIIMVVLTTVAVRYWLYAANKLRTRGAKVRFTINERYFLNEYFPYYKELSSRDRITLEERAGLLLAEIAFDRYDRQDTSKEECVIFAVVLGLLVANLPYHNCTGKIVVFRENEAAGIIFQTSQPVLFIDESVLRGVLSTLRSPDVAAQLPSDMAEILVKFYSMDAPEGKR